MATAAASQSAEEQDCIDRLRGYALIHALSPEKQALELRDVYACVEAFKQPKPSVSRNGSILPQNRQPTQLASFPRTPAGAGTIAAEGIPIVTNRHSYTFTNRWSEQRSNEMVIVYAATLRDDRSQGLVIVPVEPLDTGSPARSAEVYLTPQKSGAVSVTSADGERLTLQSTDGKTFIFDVATLTLVSL
ncbi:MAG: hypothetical protein ACR2PL_13015 [Dehalococcoidia bacterium]